MLLLKPNRDRAGRLTVGGGVTSSAGGCVSCCSDAVFGTLALPKRFFFAVIASGVYFVRTLLIINYKNKNYLRRSMDLLFNFDGETGRASFSCCSST